MMIHEEVEGVGGRVMVIQWSPSQGLTVDGIPSTPSSLRTIANCLQNAAYAVEGLEELHRINSQYKANVANGTPATTEGS